MTALILGVVIGGRLVAEFALLTYHAAKQLNSWRIFRIDRGDWHGKPWGDTWSTRGADLVFQNITVNFLQLEVTLSV